MWLQGLKPLRWAGHDGGAKAPPFRGEDEQGLKPLRWAGHDGGAKAPPFQ